MTINCRSQMYTQENGSLGVLSGGRQEMTIPHAPPLSEAGALGTHTVKTLSNLPHHSYAWFNSVTPKCIWPWNPNKSTALVFY